MKKWVVKVDRYDSKNTSTTHCVLNFYYADQIHPNKFDAYTKHFELHFQANITGFDPVSGKQIVNSDWYAATVKDISLNHFHIAARALNKIENVENVSPSTAISAVKGIVVERNENQEYYWIVSPASDSVKVKLIPPSLLP